MTTSDERRGHLPTLLACFLHFDLSFMIWVLFGSLGIFISEEAHLDPSQKGLLVALPILSGSLLRIPLGMMADRVGGKRVGVGLLAFLFLPLTIAWLGEARFPTLLATGAMLGAAGASFAVALPLASRWYPPRRQGLVMGIAAAGNSGTVITNLLAPRAAAALGWHAVFGLAMVPLAIVLVLFAFAAKEARAPRSAVPAATTLRSAELVWLCFYYAITFGGYVGLSTFTPILLSDQYGTSPIVAGSATAAIAFAGSAARPLGGYIADRIGGTRLLSVLLALLGGAYLWTSTLPTLPGMVAILMVAMLCLGMGNGAVFQLVSLRFRAEIGLATGVVGAVGGVGGFLMPTMLGFMKARTGSFGHAFFALGALALFAAMSLWLLIARQRAWRLSWRELA